MQHQSDAASEQALACIILSTGTSERTGICATKQTLNDSVLLRRAGYCDAATLLP